MTEKKARIDWGPIRSDWLKSDMSIRRLAEWYQVSEAAIRKKAATEGWGPRTLGKSAQCVLAEPDTHEPVMMAGIDATDPEQIVGRGHNLIFRLLDELDTSTSHIGQLEAMIEAHEEDPRRQAAMLKAVSLSGRAGVIKALATAFKTWNEAKAPEGVKARRQADAERVATSGRFAPRTRPNHMVN